MRNLNSVKTERAYIIGLWIAILFFLASCGTRRVNKSEIKSEEKTTAQTTMVDSSKTQVTADTNTKVTDLSESEEVLIEPVDTSKVMVVNNVPYKNAVLKRKKVSNNIVADKTEKVAQTEQKAVKTQSNVTIEKKVEAKNKDVFREQFNWTWIILLIVAIVMFLLWWYFGIGKKKNTDA